MFRKLGMGSKERILGSIPVSRTIKDWNQLPAEVLGKKEDLEKPL